MFSINAKNISITRLLFLAGCSSMPEQQIEEAWWLNKTFKAAPLVEDSPFQDNERQWTHVSVFNDAFLEKNLTESQYQYVEESSLVPSLKSDLNHDGKDETLVVGVYKSKNNEGRFLSVLNNNGDVERTFALKGKTGFSGLLQNGDLVRWYTCMACDNYGVIRWNGSSFVME